MNLGSDQVWTTYRSSSLLNKWCLSPLCHTALPQQRVIIINISNFTNRFIISVTLSFSKRFFFSRCQVTFSFGFGGANMNCLTCGLFLVVNPAFFLEMDVTTLLCPGFKNSFLGLKKKKRGINAIFAQKAPARTYAQKMSEAHANPFCRNRHRVP